MTTRTKLVFQTVKSYADFTDFRDCLENNFITDCSEYPAFQDYMKNSFITACTDYADFCDYAKNGFIMDCFDYADIQHFQKNVYHLLPKITFTGIFFCKFSVVLHALLALDICVIPYTKYLVFQVDNQFFKWVARCLLAGFFAGFIGLVQLAVDDS